MDNTFDNSFAEDLDTNQDFLQDNIDLGADDLDTIPNDDAQPFITVKYNHKLENIPLDEAKEIIQKSMHSQDTLKKLQFLANGKGISLNDYVNDVFEAEELKEIARLEEEFSDDNEGFIEALNKRKGKFEEAFLEMLKEENEPEDLNRRLADEFFELIDYFPNMSSINDLPEEVLREAAEQNKSLVVTYAIYKAKEQAKLIEANEKNNINKLSSAPSLSSTKTAGEDPVVLAMLKGIRK